MVKRCNFPTHFQLHRKPLPREEVQSLGKSVNWCSALPDVDDQPFIAIINQDNFRQITQALALTAVGRIVANDNLAQLLQGSSGLRVTSPFKRSAMVAPGAANEGTGSWAAARVV